MPAILEGIRVVDLSRLVSGPVAAQMLGDLGAEVIRVEPVEGENLDREVTYPWLNGEAIAILKSNRNKKCISLNLQAAEGREVLYKLVQESDVVVQNFRPRVRERLGVRYEDLIRHNPKIVYATVTGYGETGPYSNKKGQDLLIQGMSGVMRMNSFDDNPPIPIGNIVADQGTAKILAFGILAALFARERFGIGQQLNVSLLDSMIDLDLHNNFFYLNGGGIYRRGRYGRGNPFGSGVPYGVYQTKDGRWVAISAGLSEVCYALGVEDLTKRPQYDTPEKQREHREVLFCYVEEVMAELTLEQALGLFEAADVWAGPVYDYPETFSDPQIIHNQMVIEVENPRGGTYKTIGMPVKFSKMPMKPYRRPPRYGEHTAEVLAFLGYSTPDIERLAHDKVIALGEGDEAKPPKRRSRRNQMLQKLPSRPRPADSEAGLASTSPHSAGVSQRRR